MGGFEARLNAMTTQGYADLFRQREFRALWTGNALGVAATTMSSLTLGTLVYAQTGSAFLTAVTMFGPSLVQVVGAGTLMSAADTTPPRPVLVLLASAMTLAFAAQATFDLAPTSRVAIVLAAAYLLSIGSGVRWGLLSQIIPADDYALARSAMNVSVGVMQIVGFATGGLLLHVLSVGQVFWIAAALAALAVPVTRFGLGVHAPRRTGRAGVRETWRGNQALLSLPSTRALMLALSIPNGLVAGCEALFVPYAGDRAAPLFVAAALGMLAGDVVMGRVLTSTQRHRCTGWLRMLLAAPFLAFAWHPDVPLAALLTGMACIGYAASLGQQELLVKLTPPSLSGQVLGAEAAARVTCQGLGAVLAGSLAEAMAPAVTMALLALGSLLVSVALTPALLRAAGAATRPRTTTPALGLSDVRS
jgi:predicted MFS family arabinose efflux permease